MVFILYLCRINDKEKESTRKSGQRVPFPLSPPEAPHKKACSVVKQQATNNTYDAAGKSGTESPQGMTNPAKEKDNKRYTTRQSWT